MRIDYFKKDTITFQFDCYFVNDTLHYYKFWNIDQVNKLIKAWDKYGTCLPAYPPTKGPMKSSDTLSGIYLNWPINANLYNGDIGHEDPGYLNFNLEIQNNHYARINRGIPFTLNDSAKLSLKHSDTYTNNARLYVENNSLFSVKPTATLEINKYGNVIIEAGGVINLEENSNLVFRDHGEIIVDSGGTLNNCGAIISDTTFVCIIVHPQGHYNVGYQFCTHSAIHNFTKGAFLVLNGGDLTIGNSSKIVFDGSNSFLKINPQSRVFFGENASIEFKNGAYISANGCTFSSIDSTKNWKGIILENSDIDSITNCAFSNAKSAISIKNSPTGSYTFTNRVIKNNTFNIPSGGDHRGIYGENNYRILIQDNTFEMPVTSQGGSPYYVGVYLKNSSTSGDVEAASPIGEEDEDIATATPYSLNLIHNVFNNGSNSVILANYTSNILPYYIKGNTFNAAYLLSLLGMKITGTIRDNVSTDSNTELGLHLINSSPNMYNNAIFSKNVSLHLIGNCYPNLAPYISGSQMVWSGGKNRFTTDLYDNVQLVGHSNVYTDFGENRFNILDTANSYHIYGWLDSTIFKYSSRNNCWYPGNIPRIYLRHDYYSSPIITETGVSTIDCDHEIDPNGWEVDYLGNGIYDSVMMSADITGQITSTENLLYEQANQYFNESMFLDAISSYKNLIDNYPDYIDLPKSALNLYSSYEYLDTLQTQGERNTLYGNLKLYAEGKLSSTEYKNEEFTDICFDIVTMCEANMENYDAASNNYEFIALYHPDPDARLNASWNYAEVQALINSGMEGLNFKLQMTNYK